MKFRVNKSTGYELSGVNNPVDAVVDMPPEAAAKDVEAGYLVPESAPAVAQPAPPAPRDGGVADPSLSELTSEQSKKK